jgi:hypothetical protein
MFGELTNWVWMLRLPDAATVVLYQTSKPE